MQNCWGAGSRAHGVALDGLAANYDRRWHFVCLFSGVRIIIFYSDLFGSCGGSVINSKYAMDWWKVSFQVIFFRWILTAYHCVALDRVNFEVICTYWPRHGFVWQYSSIAGHCSCGKCYSIPWSPWHLGPSLFRKIPTLPCFSDHTSSPQAGYCLDKSGWGDWHQVDIDAHLICQVPSDKTVRYKDRIWRTLYQRINMKWNGVRFLLLLGSFFWSKTAPFFNLRHIV